MKNRLFGKKTLGCIAIVGALMTAMTGCTSKATDGDVAGKEVDNEMIQDILDGQKYYVPFGYKGEERTSEADNSIHYTEKTAKDAASDNPSASSLYNYLINSEILNG
ncbi:hypothetical protein [Butyrivibrio sp. AD3002]|uniref:hypothetical protein n=1 Tax=Butyrivibrio sp. AD3002 TaxID=1280670 RepID=UPI0003B3B8AA|nr:hypothetical protein [Butyrivibrio sp. AD3002]